MAREIGLGTSLQASSTAIFTSPSGGSIGRMRGLSGPTAGRNDVDITAYDSTAREFLPGIKDFGELNFELVWDPVATTGHSSVRRWYLANEIVNWKIVHPTTTSVVTFDGYVKSLGPTYPMDDALAAAVVLKVTGAVIWPV